LIFPFFAADSRQMGSFPTQASLSNPIFFATDFYGFFSTTPGPRGGSPGFLHGAMPIAGLDAEQSYTWHV
jgi:hypothetical protein